MIETPDVLYTRSGDVSVAYQVVGEGPPELGPARAIGCATAIVDEVRRLGLEVRAGVHTGEC